MISFEEWLNENTTLSQSSIYKYAHAIGTISSDMKAQGIIRDDISSLSTIQLEQIMKCILENPFFATKNTTGNHMYSNALKQFRLYRLSVPVFWEHEIIREVNRYRTIDQTERSEVIKARIGQGLFRTRLLEKYDGKCMITGISNSKLLIASHIKPWAVSNNEERLSGENGFLLSPTFDKLFDSGLISFRNNGELLISKHISSKDAGILRLSEYNIIDIKPSSEIFDNLEYHRNVIFQ